MLVSEFCGLPTDEIVSRKDVENPISFFLKFANTSINFIIPRLWQMIEMRSKGFSEFSAIYSVEHYEKNLGKLFEL